MLPFVVAPIRPGPLRVCLLLLLLLMTILVGCRSGAGVARSERLQGRQAKAESSKTANSQYGRSRATPAAGSTQSASLAADNKPADKPLRLIPEWLRLGQDKESVPLPTTPGSDQGAETSVTGPVEHFQ